MDWLIIAFCVIFTYQSGQLLLAVPLAEWRLEQYALALVVLAAIAAGIRSVIRVYKSSQDQRRAQKERDEADRRRKILERNSEDLSYLDEDLEVEDGPPDASDE